MDLLPGASLELRIYVILGLVGIMFFSAILALAIGRFASLKSASQLDTLTDDSVFARKAKPEKIKKVKEPKPAKEKASLFGNAKKAETVDDLIVEEKPEEKIKFKEDKPKKRLFGKKKVDAIQLLAAPSGYEEEYAPAATRNFDSEIPEVVEYVDEDIFADTTDSQAEETPGEAFEATEVSESVREEELQVSSTAKENNSFNDIDDWNAPDAEPVKSEEEKRKKSDSPFGGNDDWEF